jgi:hypothetical protein
MVDSRDPVKDSAGIVTGIAFGQRDPPGPETQDLSGVIAENQAALERNANDRVALQKLLEAYSETEQWKEAVVVLLRIADLETDLSKRGKYLYAVAVLERDQLQAIGEASQHFEQALDAFFAQPVTAQSIGLIMKACHATELLLTKLQSWTGLERLFKGMIERLPPEAFVDIKIELHHALGEVYRTALLDMDAATAAFTAEAELRQKLAPQT